MESSTKIRAEFHDFIIKCLKSYGPWLLTEEVSLFPHATCITKDGIIIGANSHFANLCGYSIGELDGMLALELTHSDDHQILKNAIASNHESKYPLRLITKSGNTKHTNVFPYVLNIEDEVYRLTQFIDLSEAIESQKRVVGLLSKTTSALSYTIEKRDPYTVGHMNRTGAIAEKLANALGLCRETISNTLLGARIHDIGKVAVPTEILVKPSQLDDLEWQYIKRHPIVGYEIIAELDLPQIVKDIVRSHHEYHDGSGYPDGLSGKEISTEVGIITIADSLDAIAGVRPYRSSKTFDEAIEIMRSCHNRYDPDLLDLVASLVHNKEIASTEYFG